ncbi:MAG TPA: hypothetical protein VFW19_10800 [Allosphingosinicella sp.]|nr:hypothetical protein [Allosphingosinicella sp.]
MNDVVKPEDIMRQARGEAASQATIVEQSRAIAEVQGALLVAQRCPREETAALARIRTAAAQLPLAERAFFKFPRGGETVSGESIHLAVEMARCWGNIAYGIAELSRSDRAGESEMLAYAWDLETNTKSQMGFIVPHRRDTRNGVKALTDMRDIYENNANMGARRLRECIFRVLPAHVIELGKATCIATLEKGESDKPLTVRLAELFEAAEKMGISRARIEAKLGPAGGLTQIDAANLHVSLRSVKRGEVSADEEFPRVGVEEATAAARRVAGKGQRQETITGESPNAEEGRAESQMGDGFSGAKDEHPARRVADDIIRAAGTQGTIIDLANLKAARSADVAAMPDDMAADVEAAYADAEKRLKTRK